MLQEVPIGVNQSVSEWCQLDARTGGFFGGYIIGEHVSMAA